MRTFRKLTVTAATASLVVGGLWMPSSASASMPSIDSAGSAGAAVSAPAASRVYRFGASINGTDDVARLSTLLGHPLTTVRRFYLHSPPATWGADKVLATVPANGTVAVSFKAGTPAQIQTFLAGHPATTKVYASYWHEPEDNYTTATQQAAYRTSWHAYAPAIRNAHAIPTLVLMKWSLDSHSGRNWRSWFPAGDVDAMAFDAYNTAAKAGKYGDPASYLAPVQAVQRVTGLPWALTEVGSYIPAGTTSAQRAAWVDGVATAAAADPHFRFATWWDATTDSGLDYRLDANAAKVWHK